MNINNIHNSIINSKGLEMSNSNLLINNLIQKLSAKCAAPRQVLDEFEAQNDDFKKRQHGIYTFNDYYIFYGANEYFDNDIEGYKIANKTGIKSAPALIKTVNFPEQEVVIVLKLPYDNSKLLDFNQNLSKLGLVERLQALDDFKTMLNNDYINISAVESTDSWRLSPDNRLILLLWNNLTKVTNPDVKIDYLNRVKKYLKINNDNPQHTFYIY